MNIAVIGAGFTGLSAAYELTKLGHKVSVFERDAKPGGLAVGYQKKGWEWSLEKHYHHWFTNDDHIINLAKKIGHPIIIRRPKTSTFIHNSIHQLDSVGSVLRFSELSLFERLRMGMTLGLLRFNPWWKLLEQFRTADVLPKVMGKKPYRMLWEPLLRGKFHTYADTISLAWFWGRIVKRTSFLVYPAGGYLAFARVLEKQSKNAGGTFFYDTDVTNLTIRENKKIRLLYKHKSKQALLDFDAAVITVPLQIFSNIARQLPKHYIQNIQHLKEIGAVNVILRLREPLLKDGTYWLNICEPNSPLLAIIEHTHFMDKEHYNGEHLVYLGNYVPHTHEYFSMTAKELLQRFDNILKKLNPSYKKLIIGYDLFKSAYAQPIITTDYHRYIPTMDTPLPNVFLATMQQVYPFDRGTTWAVDLGKKASQMI